MDEPVTQPAADPGAEAVMAALPHTRAHRRSAKRGVPEPDAAPAPAPATAAQPPATGADVVAGSPPEGPLALAVQAAAELAEIGMLLAARTITGIVARLPRP